MSFENSRVCLETCPLFTSSEHFNFSSCRFLRLSIARIKRGIMYLAFAHSFPKSKYTNHSSLGTCTALFTSKWDRFSSLKTQGAEVSSIGRFPLCKWCKPTALYSNLRMSSLYIDLHDGFRRTTSCACDVMLLVLRYPSCIRASFM